MTKRSRRLVILAVLLVLILLGLGGYFYWYKTTKQLSFVSIATSVSDVISPPQFLFAFSGSGGNRLQHPVGVLVNKNTVYVADSTLGKIYTFDTNGNPTGSFGTSQTVIPLYLALNPKDNLLYVTDRARFEVLKFTLQGKYVGTFDPHLPKNQLPTFQTHGVVWVPVAVGFAADGSMFVTDTLKNQRLLVFGPDGKFLKSTGNAQVLTDPRGNPDAFQFPNGIAVVGKQVFISDSNNQRIKVYDLGGNFQRLIVTQGLPRGLVGLLPFPGDKATAPVRLAQVDTLSHDVTIWNATTGERLLRFGEQGIQDGQFSYPDGVSVSANNRIFVSDSANGRIQVWGWPTQIANIPPAAVRAAPWACAIPLILLPLFLFFRKKKFFGTADFVTKMVELKADGGMPRRRRRWITTHAEYDKIIKIENAEVDFEKLFKAVDYSESDARDLMEKSGVDEPTAIILVTAERVSVACSEDEDIRAVAHEMDFEMLDAKDFIKKYGRRSDRMATDDSEQQL